MLRILPPTLRAGTRDLPDVPPLVQYLIGCFLLPILAWFSEQVYRVVLTRAATHPLVRLAQLYDLTPVVAACQTDYHAPGTKGTTPTYSIDQLVRAEFVRAWADSCADPELEWLLASNLIARWFVDLPLVGPTPITAPSTASTPGAASTTRTRCLPTCWPSWPWATPKTRAPHPRSSIPLPWPARPRPARAPTLCCAI